MKSAGRKSLKRRLTIQLLLFQIGSLFIVTAAFVAYLSSGASGSALQPGSGPDYSQCHHA